MKVTIDPDDIYKRRTDDRGRFTLGTKFARKNIELVVLDSDSE